MNGLKKSCNQYIQHLKTNKVLMVSTFFSVIVLFSGIYNIFQFQRYFTMKYTLVVVLLTILIFAINVVLLLKKGKSALVFSIIFALLFTSVSFGAQRVGSFTDRILNTSEMELSQIVVLKESKISKDDDFKKYTIGYVKSDPNGIESTKEVLKDNKADGVKSKEFNSYEELYQALINKEVEMMPVSAFAQSQFVEKEIEYKKTTKVLFERRRALKTVKTEDKDLTKDPFVVFISGVDLSGNDITSTGNSDVNILMVVNPTTKRVMMQSIPRDLWAEIPCQGNRHTKLTYAGAYGGLGCSMDAISKYFDVNIDYYAKINFQGVEDLVDAMGGINVYSDTTYCSGDVCFNEGENQVDGKKALLFSRIRKVLAKGDVARGIHQMEVIRGVVNKFLEEPSLSHLNALMGSVESNFVTNLKESDISEALTLLTSLSSTIGDMESYSIEGEFLWDTDEISGEYLYYYYPSEGQVQLVHDRIQGVMDGKLK